MGSCGSPWNSICISDVVSYFCRARSPDLDLFAMGRLQTADVGYLNRLGALAEKLDKCVSAWYNFMRVFHNSVMDASLGPLGPACL